MPGPYYGSPDDLANQMSGLNVAQGGYNKLWVSYKLS